MYGLRDVRNIKFMFVLDLIEAKGGYLPYCHPMDLVPPTAVQIAVAILMDEGLIMKDGRKIKATEKGLLLQEAIKIANQRTALILG